MTFKTVYSLPIAASASLSTQVTMNGAWPKAVYVPAGTAGAYLSFKRGQSSNIGYCRSPTDGAKITKPFTAGAWVELDPGELASMDTLSIETCSASDGAAQTQSGAVTLIVIGLSD